MRRLTYLCAALAALSLTAALTDNHAPAAGAVDAAPAVAAAPLATAAPTTAATAPPTTTTPPTAPAPAPRTVATAPPTATRPASPRTTAAAPPVPVAVQTQATGGGKAESCGWAWDAQRIDDGSSDGVVVSLDAPRRPNSLATITAAPHGPTTAPTVRATTTDANGQAAVAVRLSEDKRDWTITVSALFVGSHCTAQSFTITY